MNPEVRNLILFLAVSGALCGGAYVGWTKYQDGEAAAATQASIAAKRQLVTNQLKDPFSVQFRNEVLTRDGWLCGELNSKNGFGAYVGYSRFLVRDASYYQLEGWAPVASGNPSGDPRIAEIEAQIQRLRGEGSSTTDAERNAAKFREAWAQHCV
jgi:cytochrome c-type biogenesis protein CcmH/NrfG